MNKKRTLSRMPKGPEPGFARLLARTFIFVILIFAFSACVADRRELPPGYIFATKISAWQWGYEPSVVNVRAGYPIRWTIESLDVEHTLTNEELDIHIVVPGRAEGAVVAEFTVHAPGTYEFRSMSRSGPGVSRQLLKLVVAR